MFLFGGTKGKNTSFDFDYSTLSIKGRGSKGNILTKYKVRKITQKSIGDSTLGGRKIYLDESIGRINVGHNIEMLERFNLNTTKI